MSEDDPQISGSKRARMLTTEFAESTDEEGKWITPPNAVPAVIVLSDP